MLGFSFLLPAKKMYEGRDIEEAALERVSASASLNMQHFSTKSEADNLDGNTSKRV